jgi:hypothetical protein
MNSRILFLLLCSSFLGTAQAESCKAAGAVTPVVRYYQDTQLITELPFHLTDGDRITDTHGAEWKLSVVAQPVKGQADAMDYSLTWTLEKGTAPAVAVGVEFSFSEWNCREFVFVPAVVYDGNRFDWVNMGYPPYWNDKKDWRLDMPTTFNVGPSLGKTGKGRIEINTGNAATPLMAFHSPEKQLGWMVQTTQGSVFGNHGLVIEEDKEKAEGRFAITAPSVRGEDRAVDWKTGDTFTLQFRVYTFKAPAVKDLLKRFAEVRKDLNSAERKEVLPFSETWKLLNHVYQTERWNEDVNMYYQGKLGTSTSWFANWSLGWLGGGLNTLAFMLQGDAEDWQRSIKNIETIFAKTQTPAGLFYGIGNGNEYGGFGIWELYSHNQALIREQGDWLYMAQRHFELMEAKGEKVPSHWLSGLQKEADAMVRLWDQYGQFGQWLDVETGDICVGGSASGAIVCGGLALASQTFGKNCHCGLDPQSPAKAKRYLQVAEKAAEKYYRDFVLKGYTTGGPGEILSAPDSESAFALFESFMTLYEVTKNKKWLKYTSDLLPICAGWTVSYDYVFPENSAMGKIDARSLGSVWANVANKHSAPGICTWSGDCLLKYFRVTGDRRAIELLTDIAHGFPQYISRTDHQIGTMEPGGVCERVNLSDWEGKQNVGGNIFGTCSWVEAAALLTVTQLPGVYVQPDQGFYTVLDNIQVDLLESNKKGMCLRLSNPTPFPADVKVFSESSKQAKQTLFRIYTDNVKVVHLAANESKEMWF